MNYWQNLKTKYPEAIDQFNVFQEKYKGEIETIIRVYENLPNAMLNKTSEEEQVAKQYLDDYCQKLSFFVESYNKLNGSESIEQNKFDELIVNYEKAIFFMSLLTLPVLALWIVVFLIVPVAVALLVSSIFQLIPFWPVGIGVSLIVFGSSIPDVWPIIRITGQGLSNWAFKNTVAS
jgi:pilus assembly protein TadC